VSDSVADTDETNFNQARVLLILAHFDPEMIPKNYTDKSTVQIKNNEISFNLTKKISSPNGAGVLIMGNSANYKVCYYLSNSALLPCSGSSTILGLQGKGMGIKVNLKKIKKNSDGSIETTYLLPVVGTEKVEYTALSEIKPLSFSSCDGGC